jgi:hypothetical protein
MDTYYTPRGVVTAAINTIIMRRKFQKTIDAILDGLGRLAEERAGLKTTGAAPS